MSSLLDPPFLTRVVSQDLSVRIEFDTVTRVTHGGSTTPTEYPVEDGSLRADHSVDSPDEVELSGIISSRPITVLASLNTDSFMTNGLDGRPASALEAIVDLRKSKSLVTVHTELRKYESMLILSESVTRDAATGRTLEVTMRFRKFLTATVETAAAPEPIAAVDKPTENKGPAQKKEADAGTTSGANSTAADWATSTFTPGL